MKSIYSQGRAKVGNGQCKPGLCRVKPILPEQATHVKFIGLPDPIVLHPCFLALG